MGLFSTIGGWIKSAVEKVVEKVEEAVDWVKDKLGSKTYDNDSLEDQIDVDKVLSEFRDSIQGDIENTEKKCMSEIANMFSELKEITQDRFPDLVEIIDEKQKNAEKNLDGTIMRYVKEHLSKNDYKFVGVLEMEPGQAKSNALNAQANKILEDAEAHFYKKLKKYVEGMQKEFAVRLNTRLDDQEMQMKEYIARLEMIEKQAKEGSVDVDEIVNECAPIMEVAGCISAILEM